MNTLLQIHTAIDFRVNAIRENQPDWLCGKGCGGCCQKLAQIPRLTRDEWTFLQEGLACLPAEMLATMRQRILALATDAKRPVVCPLLDVASQSCPVYAHRPVACRSYGFYVQRDLGVYCHEIEAQVAAGKLDAVIWGNHDVIDRELAACGEARLLTEWFAQDRA